MESGRSGRRLRAEVRLGFALSPNAVCPATYRLSPTNLNTLYLQDANDEIQKMLEFINSLLAEKDVNTYN
jgi:hypothetical protein